MSIRHLFLMAALMGTATPWMGTTAHAADTLAAPSDVRLEQVLQAARQNPDVTSAQRAADAARADVLAADRAPAPTLSAGVSSIDLQNGVGSGSFWTKKRLDKSLGLDWTWERGNKRALRTEVAERSARAAQADGTDMSVIQQIGAHNAFYDLLAAQHRLQTVQGIAQSAQQLADTAARRLKAGDLSAQEAARTRIEAERARADVHSAQLEQQQATQALSIWTGQKPPASGWTAQGAWPANNTLATGTEAAIDALVEQRPDVLAARERVAAAQAALQAAQALRSTDPSIGASFDHYPGTSTRLLAVRISVPLAGSQRFDGEIGRALAQEQQSQDLLQKTRLQAHSELMTLMQGWQASAGRMKIYDEQIVPQATQVAAQAELAYSKGGLTLTDLLDARRTLKTTQLEALAVRSEHAKALGTWQLRSASDTTKP
jgi:cobalt-zinc-cadmium efflux system outer membrane protein